MTISLKYLPVIFVLQNFAQSHPEGAHDFCSGVRRMNAQCNAYGNGEWQTNSVLMRGKAGPKGAKGEDGSDATIDYEILERIIQRMVENATLELMQKYAEIKVTVDHHSKKLNEIEKDLEAKSDCSKVYWTNSTTANEGREFITIIAGGQRFDVSCDLSTDGGGWTVIQRRMNGAEDFFRNHLDYVKGFGNISAEFWIGLDNLYNILQTSKQFELRIDMEDWSGVKKYAKYSEFDVGSPEADYPLRVAEYSGNAGDSLVAHSGAKFSTKDRDLDTHSGNCAQKFKGAWWYTACHNSNLNGVYHQGGLHDSYADGVNWETWKGHRYSLKFVEMKIRPISA